MSRVRTRFAPSPTGELHLGNARTAVLNWLFARHHGGHFVLRFEDTDIERQVDTAEIAIREGLDWLGLDRDEEPGRGGKYGPYRQSERLTLYREVAEGWLEEGLVYPCYCSAGELETRRAARLEAKGHARYDGRCRELSAKEAAALRRQGRLPVLRFRVEEGPVVFKDQLRGRITVDTADFGDMVILRSDGRPTYNFAVVVDDHLMDITHVIRGDGHLGNTPKQVLLFRALRANVPEFVHVPTVLAPGGGKLSKREGAPGLESYRRQGYHPEAVLNYLSLLSWSSPSGQEVLTRKELVREIDLDRMGTSQPILDPEKMKWLSGQHIRRESPESLAERIAPFIQPERFRLSSRDLIAFAEVVQPRIHLLEEAAVEAQRIFGEPGRSDRATAVLAAPQAIELLQAVAAAWEQLGEWSQEEIRAVILAAGEEIAVTGGALFRPIRVALTGELRGPELADVAYALGRERSVRRLLVAR